MNKNENIERKLTISIFRVSTLAAAIPTRLKTSVLHRGISDRHCFHLRIHAHPFVPPSAMTTRMPLTR